MSEFPLEKQYTGEEIAEQVPASFFRKRHEELMRGKNSIYAALSGSGRKKFIEIEYHLEKERAEAERQEKIRADIELSRKAKEKRQAAKEAERQAQEKAEAGHRAWWATENERRKRIISEFESLRIQIPKATTREELVELSKKLSKLAPQTGVSYKYTSHCWNCKEHISSAIHAQCPGCKYYICGSCGACFCPERQQGS